MNSERRTQNAELRRDPFSTFCIKRIQNRFGHSSQSAGNSRIGAPHPPSAPSPRCGGEKVSESSSRSYETADLLAFSPIAVGDKVPKADEGVARSERPPQFGQHGFCILRSGSSRSAGSSVAPRVRKSWPPRPVK